MEKLITKIIIVDDHLVVRAGLRALLAHEFDISIVGEFECAKDVIAMVGTLKPHVILFDVRMPGMDPIEAITKLRSVYVEAKILILTACAEARMMRDLLRAGAAGYILKDASSADIINGIRAVAKGQAWLHPTAQKILLDLTQRPSDILEDLSSRQLTLLKLLAQGLSNREIGEVLRLTEGTVKSYVSNLLTRLNLADRTQAALYAVKTGLVASDELLLGMELASTS